MGLGAIIGAVAGPLQASSRVLMAQLSPADRMTQAFGLFALSGKVTSFAGPLAVAVVTGIAQSQRIGVSAIVAFFAAGLVLVRRVAAPGPA
jgi:MFS transporter, UMF1 family